MNKLALKFIKHEENGMPSSLKVNFLFLVWVRHPARLWLPESMQVFVYVYKFIRHLAIFDFQLKTLIRLQTVGLPLP